LNLLVVGFSHSERKLLNAVVELSKRRPLRLNMLSASEGELADVVLIDSADTQARDWISNQLWLQQKVAIWVDEPEGFGRTVLRRPMQWVSLPIVLTRLLEQAPEKRTAATGNGSVLVVDDSIAVRGQLRSLLEGRGLPVTDVGSAEAAIQTAANSYFDCILMDVIMPGIDGYDACRRIKANASGGNQSAIVMLTSKSSPFDRIRGKMAGCDAYLTKPINPDQLYEVVSRHIEKSQNNEAGRQRMAQFAY
jgi:twitching motility two-component system response regulator PilG